MKVVIPYKDDRRDGYELRYAIRSLEQHFTAFTSLLLVGDTPSWYKGQRMYCDDVPGRKEYSIYRKLMLGAEGDTVFYTNDDFFYLQDFEGMPNFYQGLCGERKPMDKTYRELYGNCWPKWKDFDVHCGMVIDTSRFVWEIDRPIKTYYANQNNLEGVECTDRKFRKSEGLEYDYVMQQIEGRLFFSTYDNAHSDDMPKVLQELYPKKSSFEK